jgi:hypothetical protein
MTKTIVMKGKMGLRFAMLALKGSTRGYWCFSNLCGGYLAIDLDKRHVLALSMLFCPGSTGRLLGIWIDIEFCGYSDLTLSRAESLWYATLARRARN